MRNLVFVAPFGMDATLRFSRGLATLANVRVLGVFQQPPKPDEARHFHDIALVGDALDPASIIGGIQQLVTRHGPPFRITGILEPLQTPLAVVRRHFGVPGPDPLTAERFRDKSLMKDTLRQAGLPCARHRLLTSVADGVAFAQQVGLPIVIKPPAGAGCRATWRIDRIDELQQALEATHPSPQQPVLAEEFLRGEEASFEMVVLGGKVAAHSLSLYLPSPLEVMQTPWMQWVCLLPRDISGKAYEPVRKLGAKAVAALGLEDGIAHMEWFRRPDGSLAIGEIAARPPGGQLSAMTGLVHDVDIYRTWARAVVDGAFDGPWRRQYAAATVFLRGVGRGRVARVDGLDEANRAVGKLVEEVRLPRVGAPKTDTYEGDGFVILRHPDEAVVREAVRVVLNTVRVRYA
jgi:formate-dependent phosphoribosylglycinamide formyltransferase (GAR transformylase)